MDPSSLSPYQRLLSSFQAGAEPNWTLREHSLRIDGELTVDLSDEGDDVLGLYCVVHSYMGDAAHWLLEEIGEANYGCAGTNGATLGVHPATRSVLLARLWPIKGLDDEDTRYLVSLFIETAMVWRTRLARLRDQSEEMDLESGATARAQNPYQNVRV